MVTRTVDRVLSEAEEEYRKRTPRSAEVFDRALKTFPGGDFRRGIFIGPYAPVIDRAEGAYLVHRDPSFRLFRHRSRDVRDPRRPGLHRPEQDPQDGVRLPRKL